MTGRQRDRDLLLFLSPILLLLLAIEMVIGNNDEIKKITIKITNISNSSCKVVVISSSSSSSSVGERKEEEVEKYSLRLIEENRYRK